jgi:hypothetical protein
VKTAFTDSFSSTRKWLRPVEHGLGAFFRRAGRQLHDGEHRALVFLGQEGAGQADEQQAHHQVIAP